MKKRLPVYHVDYLANRLQELGWDPVAEMFRALAEVENPKDRADLIEKIWRYCFPTKRSVEVSGKIEHLAVTMTPDQIGALLANDAFKRDAIPAESKPIEQPGETEDPFSAES